MIGTVVVVDGYSTGRHLLPAVSARGWRCVHVHSAPEVPSPWRASYVVQEYAAELWHSGTVERMAAALARYEPSAVIPGAESGVVLADQLTAALGVPGNGPAKAAARRDKYLMNEALREAGVPAMDHCKSGSVAELRRWAERRSRWPVVVKPVRSAGTDHVTLCHTPADIEESCRSILSADTVLGERNEEVLLQEYLLGREYMVNTISRDGRHHVSDIWHCPKRYVDRAPVHDREELQPYEGHEELVAYAMRALDALQVRFGAAHVELVRTADGPRLLEIGARLEGGIDPAAVAACVGHDPVGMTVDSYVDPAAYQRFAQASYRPRRSGLCVLLICPTSGVLRSITGFDRVRALDAYFSSRLTVRPGEWVRATRDLQTIPGLVYLVHEDPARLEHGYRTIRELERDGLYDIEPGTDAEDEYVPGRSRRGA